MMYYEIFEIDCSVNTRIGSFESKFPPSLNNRLHWVVRSRANALWKARTRCVIGRRKPKHPLRFARVTFVRHTSRHCDDDNLVTSMKSVRDALVDGGVLVDDTSEYLKADYRIEIVKRGREKITIEVQEVENA